MGKIAIAAAFVHHAFFETPMGTTGPFWQMRLGYDASPCNTIEWNAWKKMPIPYKNIAKAAAMSAVTLGYASLPVIAYAVDATDNTYSHELLNSESAAGSENANAWVAQTIQNNSVTGYDDKGDVSSVLMSAQAAFRGIFTALLGTLIVLFAVKMVGRAIVDMTTRDEETVENIPMFFQTAKERSSIKEPTIMRVRGGLLGGASIANGGGKPLSQLNRNYTGPSYLSDHPYIEFMKEFVAYMLAAFAAFVIIEVILGVASGMFTSAQGTNGGRAFSPQDMFGVNF